MKTRHVSVIALIAVTILSWSGAIRAQAETPASHARATVALSQPALSDPGELEAFLDSLMKKQMEEKHIAGASVSIVKDGEILLSKGYGFSDIEKKTPVDPLKTGFRLGSVSKLFTWTAVMQLVSQGKLDLDADVNTYLDFRIPSTYPQPITLRHLMTHTAGFEDRFTNFILIAGMDFIPWRKWLIDEMPARIQPPGVSAAYSNYGTSVAGYIVQRVSGRPFAQYLQENILNPLGMTHTNLMRLDQKQFDALSSRGYSFKDGAFKPFPFYLGHPAILPVGGIESTAGDMALFMIAHLKSHNGAAPSPILDGPTARKMHSVCFNHDPRLQGTTLGFFDLSDNGVNVIGHSGEAMPFNTNFLLLPDRNIGIFVAYNSAGGGDLTIQHLGFQRAFFDHYFPAPPVKPIRPPADFASRAPMFEGLYRLNRSSYTTLEKVASIMGLVEIKAHDDGTLHMITPWGTWRFVEAAPLFFRQVDGSFGIIFRKDSRGRITQIYTSFTPMFGFEKLPWYETPAFTIALLAACTLLFITSLADAAYRAVRNRRATTQPAEERPGKNARLVITAVSVVNILFIIGTVIWGNPKPVFGVPMQFKIVLGLGVLSAALTALSLAGIALSWKNRFWTAAVRIHLTAAVAAQIAFIWFLNNWNLLGWKF